MESNVNKKLINISTHTFIVALVMLASLMVFAIVLTYVIPRGEYSVIIQDGEEIIDYTSYHRLEGTSGINILKGIFAPIL